MPGQKDKRSALEGMMLALCLHTLYVTFNSIALPLVGHIIAFLEQEPRSAQNFPHQPRPHPNP